MHVKELINPQPLFADWSRAVQQAKVPGSILLCGPKGSELLPMALAMIRLLQCEHPSFNVQSGFGESCMSCPACKAFDTLEHPDMLLSFPVTGTGATAGQFLSQWREATQANPYLDPSKWLQSQSSDNKQGNINREEVQRIFEHLSLTNFSKGYKVVLIWGADYLGLEGNRLLKAIEEPEERSLFVLCTTRTERILPTILSRCQIYQLGLPSIDEMAAQLSGKMGMPLPQAMNLLLASGADLGEAFAFAKTEEQALQPVADWLRACFTGKGSSIIPLCAQLATLPREHQKLCLERAIRLLREVGLARSGLNRPLQLSAAEAEVAQKLAPLVGWSQLEAMHEELEKLLVAIERNANAKIAFTAASIRLHHILANARREAAQQPRPMAMSN